MPDRRSVAVPTAVWEALAAQAAEMSPRPSGSALVAALLSSCAELGAREALQLLEAALHGMPISAARTPGPRLPSRR